MDYTNTYNRYYYDPKMKEDVYETKEDVEEIIEEETKGCFNRIKKKLKLLFKKKLK